LTQPPSPSDVGAECSMSAARALLQIRAGIRQALPLRIPRAFVYDLESESESQNSSLFRLPALFASLITTKSCYYAYKQQSHGVMLWPAACIDSGMHRILFVDDEETIRFALSEYFTQHGCLVDCAENVEEAEALLESGPYSVLIADVRLAGLHDMSGFTIVKTARERDPETLIVVLTAYQTPEIQAQAWRYGIGALLHKPLPLQELAQVIFGLLAGARNSTRFIEPNGPIGISADLTALNAGLSRITPNTITKE